MPSPALANCCLSPQGLCHWLEGVAFRVGEFRLGVVTIDTRRQLGLTPQAFFDAATNRRPGGVRPAPATTPRRG